MSGMANLKAKVMILVVLAGLGFSAAAEGRTIYVDNDGPADFNNIQAAINDANDGDTVLVADGTYTGNGNRDIDFLGKAITVRSENGPENCIIDCNGTETEPHRGFYFHSDEDANSVLDGFTIANGYDSSGGGIYCDNSSPTINNCIITDNSAENDGGGIYCVSSSPTLIDCTFSNNSVPTYDLQDVPGGEGGNGGGMYNRESSNPLLTNCTFSDNLAYGGGGIVNYLECSPTLSNCLFSGNLAEFGGGVANYQSNQSLTNCTFSDNFANWGSAMIHLHSSSPTLTNCILWDGGGEIWNNDGSTITITYSDIQGGQTAVYDPCEGLIWGEGNIDTDPLFVDPNSGDCHLKSQAGRWNPNSQSWVKDDVTSPCIDAGDPMSPIGFEPFPNGGVINMGAYGGTSEASKSYFGEPVCETIVAGDINGDCKINLADFLLMALHWLEDNNQ